MSIQAHTAGSLKWALAAAAALILAAAIAATLLPTTVGRVIGDLWVNVMSAIGQLLGG
jgi:hypothetical protein